MTNQSATTVNTYLYGVVSEYLLVHITSSQRSKCRREDEPCVLYVDTLASRNGPKEGSIPFEPVVRGPPRQYELSVRCQAEITAGTHQ